MTRFRLRDGDELTALRAYLGRLLALDDRGAVRLQAAGAVLGVWGGPPLDVVALRPVALAGPVESPADVTVSARRLLERLDALAEIALPPGEVEMPPQVPGPAWAGLLPPRGGWELRATVPAAVVHDAVRVAVEAFRRRVDLIPADRRSQPALEAVAQEIWAGPVVADVPLRAAHAAELLGLLGRADEVSAFTAGPWARLACPGGSVAIRRDGATAGLAMDLGVWALTPTPG